MTLTQELTKLVSIADEMNALRKERDPTLLYDILADALYWSDELPMKMSKLVPSRYWCLRFVLRYRTSLILDSPDKELSVFWEEAKSRFPNWVGFDPSRCSANSKLAQQYVIMKKVARD